MQSQNQKQLPQRKQQNENRAFIYTNECTMCGGSKPHNKIVFDLQEKGFKVRVKQVKLWRGWAEEAEKIGIELPFVWIYDTQKGKTIEDALKNGIDDICDISLLSPQDSI